jgi:hypothetical protein
MVHDQRTNAEVGYALIFLPRILRVVAAQRTLAGSGVMVFWVAEVHQAA